MNGLIHEQEFRREAGENTRIGTVRRGSIVPIIARRKSSRFFLHSFSLDLVRFEEVLSVIEISHGKEREVGMGRGHDIDGISHEQQEEQEVGFPSSRRNEEQQRTR